MPAVFVHGVPETPAVWEPLRAQLSRDDVVTLGLPGFGRARPDGFGATKEEYVGWLAGELEQLQEAGPVDLVGHDWGGAFAVRLVSTRPELVRSWALDAASVADVRFEWHPRAKVWQTPGAGEELFAAVMAATLEENAARFEALAVPTNLALAMASWADETMGSCILDLYRSAVDVGREWAGAFVDIPKPGLVIVPGDDTFLSPTLARAAAQRAGAEVADLVGIGHWWMLQDPRLGAEVLEAFWAGMPGRQPG